MERSGPAFFEEDDDDEDDFNSAEVAPKEDEPSFVEKLKKVMGIEEEGGDTKNKGLLERLSSDQPELAEVDQPEESPQENEAAFSLSILGESEAEPVAEQEPLVEPHHTQPTVVAPEMLAEDEAEPADEPEEFTLRQQPLQQQATQEAIYAEPEATPAPEAEPVTEPDEPEDEPILPAPPTYTPPGAVPGATVAETAVPFTGPMVETDDFATHREATRKAMLAGAAGVGAAIVANSRAKSRETKIEERAEEREQALQKQVERNQRQTEAQQASLRRQLETNQYADNASDQPPRPVPETPQKPRPERVTPPTNKGQGRSEWAPKPQPLNETYSPDVHDRIPPKVAFEQLTGIEQPQPRTLEQERRHEVKDAASKTPVSYTQIDPQSPWHQPQSNSPQSARSTLMGLGSNTSVPLDHQLPARTPSHPYKKAIVSGAVTAAVILSAFAVFMLIS